MSSRRFTDKPGLDPTAVRSLPSGHPAMAQGRTLFPSTVVNVDPHFSGRLLVSGENNRKLGERVEKGQFKGYALFGLTLEERATCPSDCSIRGACYGNGMQLARRHHIADADAFYKLLEAEIVERLASEPVGLMIRLHVLGDFPSVEYVAFWSDMLAEHERLSCYGYTHRRTKNWGGDIVGDAVQNLKDQYPDRFRIRWSSATPRPDGAVVIDRIPDRPRVDEGLVCPAQSEATACCATCGLCWEASAKNDTIAFIKHGPKSNDAAAAVEMRPKKDEFEKLVVATKGWLTNYATKLCRDAIFAEDLVQETFVRALANRESFDGLNLSAWLTTILKNYFLSTIRKKKEGDDPEGILTDRLVSNEDQHAALEAKQGLDQFSKLPTSQRDVIKDIALGMSYQDAADKHKIAEGTIKSRVNRGREALKERTDVAEPRPVEGPRIVTTPRISAPDDTNVRPVKPIALPPMIVPARVVTDTPQMRLVFPTDLRVEAKYQRDLTGKSIKLIRKIVAGWDWSKFKAPVCAETQHGLFVIDGQHTAIAAATHPAVGKIPVLVVSAAMLEQRADAFVAHNRDRLAMSVFQVFHAEVAAGNKEALAVLAAANRVGATIPRSQPLRGYAKVGQVIPVNELRRIFRVDGVRLLEDILNIAVRARQAPVSLTVIRATRMLLKEQRFAAVRARGTDAIAKAIASFKNIDLEARNIAAATDQGRDRACAVMIEAAVLGSASAA